MDLKVQLSLSYWVLLLVLFYFIIKHVKFCKFNNTTGYEKTHFYTMLRFRLFFI